MEIGPIAGIRPVTMIKPPSPSPDLSGVFAVEFRKQARDETGNRQRAARGLEDEESDLFGSVEDESAPEEAALGAQPRSKVSFFA